MLSPARIKLIYLLVILLLLPTAHVEAQWSSEGIVICSATGYQSNPQIIHDGVGGAIVVWEDYRAGNWDIHAQRIDRDGYVLWSVDGIPICTEPGNDRSPFIASDGSGGAFIAWTRDSQAYLQRIDSLGAPVASSGGISIGPGRIAALIADGAGGAIYARAYTRMVTIYPGPRDLVYCAILVQRMNASLERQWGINDAGITDQLEYADAVLAPDGTGGAFVMYEGAFEDPRVTQLDGQANVPWGARKCALDLRIVSDGVGGAIMGTTSVQRINASGDFLWGDAAVETGVSGGLVSDGAGGAIVGSSIVQRVNSSGSLMWGMSGIATGVTGEIVSDGDGGAIVGSSSVQRVGPGGALIYPLGGLATGATAGARLVGDGMHGVFLAWSAADGIDMGIFIQRIPHGSAPVLDPIGDRRADVGSELVIDCAAAGGDPEDTLTYWTDAADVLQSPFTFDDRTGEFRCSPLMADAGEHRVTFGVRGSGGGDFERITIRVYFNGTLPPRLDPIPSTVVNEGYPVVIEAHAFDPDGDPLSFSISDARFAQNGNVFTWRTQVGDAGAYYPVIAVTDGILADSVQARVEIAPATLDQFIRDPMTGPASVNGWHGNLVSWNASSGAFLSASTTSWNAAVVSDSVLAGTPRTFIVRIEHKAASTNYMLGMTDTPPAATDFNYERIDIGIYVNSSGSIRPAWDPNNSSYWNASIAAGLYDIRIALDASGSASFAIDDVSSIDAPLSSFGAPVWSAVESRGVPDACHMQINPYSSAARVYDVWRPGVVQSDTGGTVLEAFSVAETNDWVRIQWTLGRCSATAHFFVCRAAAGGAFEEISDPALERIDMQCTFIDTAVVQGTAYRYRIDVEDEDGRKTLFETEAVTVPWESTVFAGFTIAASDSSIDLGWALNSCALDARFFAFRKPAGGAYGELSGAEISQNGFTFTLADESVVAGTTYSYRVEVDDRDGRRELFETYPVAFAGAPVPRYTLALGQNYPNPFNPGTMIEYTLPIRCRVVIEIFDVRGRRIRRLVDMVMDSGPHNASWDGLDAGGRRAESGVYFFRLAASGSYLTRKMIILK